MDKLASKVNEIERQLEQIRLRSIIQASIVLDKSMPIQREIRQLQKSMTWETFKVMLIAVVGCLVSLAVGYFELLNGQNEIIWALIVLSGLCAFSAVRFQMSPVYSNQYSGILRNAIEEVDEYCATRGRFADLFTPFKEGIYENEEHCVRNLVKICKSIVSKIPEDQMEEFLGKERIIPLR